MYVRLQAPVREVLAFALETGGDRLRHGVERLPSLDAVLLQRVCVFQEGSSQPELNVLQPEFPLDRFDRIRRLDGRRDVLSARHPHVDLHLRGDGKLAPRVDTES